MLIPVTDAEDPRIGAFRAVRERDLVGREDRFVVEGEVVLRVFLSRSRFAPESLLIAENRVEALKDCLAAVPASVPIYTAGRSVMDAIVGFPIHRGILATGRRGPPTSVENLLARAPDDALAVGLIGLANHDNVGGIFRNAAAFGVHAVLLDPTTCDPLYRKAIRVSVGGSLTVPFTRTDSIGTMRDALQAADFDVLALSPSGCENLTGFKPRRRTAVLLGAEGAGLPADVLATARTVSIPMSGGFDSLNVATTSGIVLHHLATARGAA
jgi:tRNA G18 (ribose-2'-O)-methylase SpoU